MGKNARLGHNYKSMKKNSIRNLQYGAKTRLIRGIYSTSQILSSVSLSMLTVISVDRLYVLILGLRYRQIVTLKRVGLKGLLLV